MLTLSFRNLFAFSFIDFSYAGASKPFWVRQNISTVERQYNVAHARYVIPSDLTKRQESLGFFSAVPSPMNPVSHTHPGHPSLAHFRGPSSTPGSPGVASQHKSTPLSPSVRSDSSQPQPPMRPASGHSEHSNPPVPSPISGSMRQFDNLHL